MAIIERLRVLEGLRGNISATRQHRSLQARHRHVVIFDELLVARAEVADEISLREGDGVGRAARVRGSRLVRPQRCHWQDKRQ